MKARLQTSYNAIMICKLILLQKYAICVHSNLKHVSNHSICSLFIGLKRAQQAARDNTIAHSVVCRITWERKEMLVERAKALAPAL